MKAFVEIIKKLWKILRDRNTRLPFLCPENPVCGSRSNNLKLNIKTKIMASSPITSGQIDGEKVESVTDYIFLVSRSLWTVTAAMKLKKTLGPLKGGKLWKT